MELREGYKQTEVGVIPEDWELKILDQISVISRLAGAEYSSVWEEKSNGEIIALRGFNIGENTIIERDFVRISNELSLKLKRSRLYKGDVVYPCVGTIGNAAVINESDKYHIQQNIAKITPDKKLLHPKYLVYYLMSFLGEKEVERFNATSSQPNVLVGSLRQYRVPLPKTKTEQAAIANALSDADALIQSLTRLMAKKRQIKQGAMQTLLNPYENGHLKAGWVEKKLREVAGFINGRAYSLTEWESQGTPVIRLQNLTGRGEKYYYSNLKLPEKQYCVSGDLLFMWSATFGPVIWKGEKAIYHYHIWKIECKQNKANKLYLYYILDDLTERLKRSSSSGGTMLHVTKEKMESTEVILPDVDEQAHIATILSDMDADIAALVSKLAKTQQIKQGMMQTLLTGRIRLADSKEIIRESA